MRNDESMAMRLARLGPAERAAVLDEMGISFEDLATLLQTWRFQARPSQLPPADHQPPDSVDGPKPWSYWMFSGGRGTGKTRAGAEFCTERILEHHHARTTPGHPRHHVTRGPHRVGLAGRTGPDIRDIQINGESGLVAVAEAISAPSPVNPRGRPLPIKFQPSYRRVLWGDPTDDTLTLARLDLESAIAVGAMYSSEEPDQGRGPQHHTVWADEVAAWTEVTDDVGNTLWTNLTMGLRLDPDPRAILTTTPKPVPLVVELFRRAHDPDDHGVALTFGSTADNAANLAPAFLAEVYSRYGGTRLAAQELDGQLLQDFEGTLWTPTLIAIAHRLADEATTTTTTNKAA